MPIYEYHCGNCGADLEIFQHMTDPTLTLCPQCKAEALQEVFSPVGIVFKGSGFYATDNKGSKSTLSPGEAAHGEASGEPKAETPAKTDSPKADTAKAESASPAVSTPSSSGDKKTTTPA